MALCDLTCDLIWTKGTFTEFGYPQQKIVVDEDNTGVLSYVRDRHKYAHRRHIDIKYKFVQQHWDRLFVLNDVRGAHNEADVFTKATLPYKEFLKYERLLLPGRDWVDYSSVIGSSTPSTRSVSFSLSSSTSTGVGESVQTHVSTFRALPGQFPNDGSSEPMNY